MNDQAQIKIPWKGWNIVKQLGRGGFGTVYEIERDTFGAAEKSAMKVISVPESREKIDDLYSSGLDRDSVTKWCNERVNDIVREYAVMIGLKGNQNIVSCEDIDVVQHEGDPGADIFIRMELLTPLNKLLAIIQKDEADLTEEEKVILGKLRPDNRAFTEEDVARLGKDITRALEVCEKNDIVHRDIKPENILIDNNGNFKLGDFGTARRMDHTTNASYAGTEKYMAPEVIKGEKIGKDVDIYSLGLVMYRLLNRGRFPFYPLTGIPTAEQVETAQRRRLAGEQFDPPVDGSPELKALVMKACAYDRKDRFASASDMGNAIDTVRLDNAIPAKAEYDAVGAEDDRTVDEVKSLSSTAGNDMDDESDAAADSWEDNDVSIGYPGRKAAGAADLSDLEVFEVDETVGKPKHPAVEDMRKAVPDKATAAISRRKEPAKTNKSKVMIITAVAVAAILAVALIVSVLGRAKYESYSWAGISFDLPEDWSQKRESNKADMTLKKWEAGDSQSACEVNRYDIDHNQYDYEKMFRNGLEQYVLDETNYNRNDSSNEILEDGFVEIKGSDLNAYSFKYKASNGTIVHTLWIPSKGVKWVTKVELRSFQSDMSDGKQIEKIFDSIEATGDSSDIKVRTAADIWKNTKNAKVAGITLEYPAEWKELEDYDYFSAPDGIGEASVSVKNNTYVYGEYSKGKLKSYIDDQYSKYNNSSKCSEAHSGQMNVGGTICYFVSYRQDLSEISRYYYELYIPLPDQKQLTVVKYDYEADGPYTERDKKIIDFIINSIRLE